MLLNKRTRILFTSFLVGWNAFILCTKAAVPTIPEDVKSSIRSRVDRHYNPSIIVGMANKDGRSVFAYGSTHLDTEDLPDAHTLYEIGSITKIFTTSLLAQMLDQGEVDLEDPVQDYLPETVQVPTRNGRAITLEHLATHRSGLPDNPAVIADNDPTNPFHPYPESALYETLSSHRLTRMPGASVEYSNLGLGLLGHALAKGQSKDYETLLRERILEPLGLSDTVISTTPDQAMRRAQGYTGVVERPPFLMDSLEAAGSLVSSVDDVLTFAEYLLQIRPSNLYTALNEAMTPRVSGGSPGVEIGLGWFVLSQTPSPITMHDGATLGHTAFLGLDRARQVAVVVLTNARLNPYSTVQDIGLHLLFSSYPLNSIRRPADVSQQALRDAYGTYANDSGDVFHLGIQRDHMLISFPRYEGIWYTLYPASTRTFRFYEATVEGTVTLTMNQVGIPESITWSQNGQSAVYPRRVDPFAPLNWERTGGSLALSLKDADGGTRYQLQGSADLKEWIPMDTLSLWEDSIELDLDQPMQYFRATAP